MDYKKMLHELIPGGAHTYSRGDDQFPANAPAILKKGEGAYVWDSDGNKYLDYGMGLRAVTVGYGFKPISEAAIQEIWNGNNLPRPTETEFKAAKLITDLIPGAEMVKFGKNGSTITTAAVKLSRAYTGRKMIARCGDHPFFSYDDWFIGNTNVTRGIPEEISNLTVSFNYNNPDSLEDIFNKYPNQIACVILEPVKAIPPKDNFLQKVKSLCKKYKAVFILDEMITGFRWDIQGAQKFFDVEADLVAFGKGMANGFSVSALVGKKEIMNLGGILEKGMERVFLISTTHGAEMCGLGAFIKTIEIYKEKNVIKHLWDYGKKLIDGVNDISKEYGIDKYFKFIGYPCSPDLQCKDKSGNISLPLRTLYLQEMAKENILIPWISLSYSHKETELDMTLNATKKALKVYSEALEKGVSNYLSGEPTKPVFRKYN